LAGQVHQYQDRLTSFGRHNSQSRGNRTLDRRCLRGCDPQQ
jgi:hypothetical protein